jgi:hypothetical protein
MIHRSPAPYQCDKSGARTIDGRTQMHVLSARRAFRVHEINAFGSITPPPSLHAHVYSGFRSMARELRLLNPTIQRG